MVHQNIKSHNVRQFRICCAKRVFVNLHVFTNFVAVNPLIHMKKPVIIKPWEIVFCVIYHGRYSLFDNRELVRGTLDNLARLHGIDSFGPHVPAILAESVEEDVRVGEEVWIENYCFRSGENPPMPRYMFARLIASVFGQYMQNAEMPFCIYQRGIAEMHRLGLSKCDSEK